MCDPARDLVALIRACRRNDRRAADRALTRLEQRGYRLKLGSKLPPRSKPSAPKN